MVSKAREEGAVILDFYFIINLISYCKAQLNIFIETAR